MRGHEHLVLGMEASHITTRFIVAARFPAGRSRDYGSERVNPVRGFGDENRNASV